MQKFKKDYWEHDVKIIGANHTLPHQNLVKQVYIQVIVIYIGNFWQCP